MALDLEEQEQLDEFKSWWKKYGKMTTGLLTLAIVAYVVWQGMQYYQHKQASEASELYQTLVQLNPSKHTEIKAVADKLMQHYAGTPYAGRGAVYLAKSDFVTKDNKQATAHLDWAIAHAKEHAVKAIASLQLASILLEEGAYDAAHKALDHEMDAGFAGLKANLQGDIYLAQGNTKQAKKSYQDALLMLGENGKLRLLTEQKLESLGT